MLLWYLKVCVSGGGTTLGKIPQSPPFFLEFARTVWKRERAGYLDSRTLKSLFKEWPLIYFNIWLKLLVICPASFWSFDENTDSASEHYWPHIYVFAVFFPGCSQWRKWPGLFLRNTQVYVLALAVFTQPSPTHHHLKLHLIHFISFTINRHPFWGQLWLFYHISITRCHMSTCTLSSTQSNTFHSGY